MLMRNIEQPFWNIKGMEIQVASLPTSLHIICLSRMSVVDRRKPLLLCHKNAHEAPMGILGAEVVACESEVIQSATCQPIWRT